ncbi:MAG: response regulator [Terriglobales bacterium]
MVDTPAKFGHVLVVDDEQSVRVMLQSQLVDEGYDCQVAASGAEALDMLRQKDAPEVIVLDLKMPEMSGFDFLRQTQTQIGHGFGVIVMTGDPEPGLKERATAFGAFTLIEKPVVMEELLRLIRIQQQHQRLRSGLR